MSVVKPFCSFKCEVTDVIAGNYTEQEDIYSASLVMWCVCCPKFGYFMCRLYHGFLYMVGRGRYILSGRKPDIDIRENPRLRPDIAVVSFFAKNHAALTYE